MKVLKSTGLVLGVLAICAGFGVVGSFLSQPSVHAAAKYEVSASSDQSPASQDDSIAVQTAQEATTLTQ